MSHPGWNPPRLSDVFKCRSRFTSDSATVSCSRNAVMSTSKEKASCTPGTWSADTVSESWALPVNKAPPGNWRAGRSLGGRGMHRRRKRLEARRSSRLCSDSVAVQVLPGVSPRRQCRRTLLGGCGAGWRQSMELGNFNLNLLVHLDALLAQRGVSGAAERLNLSQPTMSSALARSRRHFGDDLLRRRGVQRAFMMRPPEFDPSTSRREFVVAAAVNA